MQDEVFHMRLLGQGRVEGRSNMRAYVGGGGPGDVTEDLLRRNVLMDIVRSEKK